VVRVEGLEPPRLAAPEPKSGASTNFATPALKIFMFLTRLYQKHYQVSSAKMHFSKLFFTLNLKMFINLFFA
jgi:hypothetical protein